MNDRNIESYKEPIRLTLDVVGDSIEDIKAAVKKLLNEPMDSNCGGWVDSCHFQYFFTETNDVFKNTDNLPCVNPNKKGE